MEDGKAFQNHVAQVKHLAINAQRLLCAAKHT